MKLIKGDCESWLKESGKVKCIFMDPPDNIGLDYSGYSDNRYDYIEWLSRLIWLSQNKADIIWVSFNPKHDLQLSRSFNLYPWFSFRRIIWAYTFGQYNDKTFARNYRPIFLLEKNTATIYPDVIREESVRMRLGDDRAAGPRVPGDVWNFPRVVGNSQERQSWHPTQHPVALYDRIMKYSCGPGETFVDLFAGSGTCFRAGRLSPWVNVLGIEISEHYCDQLLFNYTDSHYSLHYEIKQ